MSLRNLQDAQLIKTIALPAAAATANSASLDIGTGPHACCIELRINIPALPALVDAKTITVKLQDSADNITFADIEELASLVITGAGGVGAAAVEREVRLPSSTNRYVRLTVIALAAAGDNTAVSASLTVLG